MEQKNNTSFFIGHNQDFEALTGVTVLLCPDNSIGSAIITGGAPGTREYGVAGRMKHSIDQVHAIVLSGGSAFGLSTADGVMKFLEEKERGTFFLGQRIPIVPSAVIFDLHCGNPRVRPTQEMAYSACRKAIPLLCNNKRNDINPHIPQGCHGVGTGAICGCFEGITRATKSGFGIAHESIGDIFMTALVVVNSFGDIVDPKSGRILAGLRNPEGPGYFGTIPYIKKLFLERTPHDITPANRNTTSLAIICTNVKISKMQANEIAKIANHGFVKTIHPVNTSLDGDVIFCVSSNQVDLGLNNHHDSTSKDKTLPILLFLQNLAQELIQRAVINAAKHSTALGGLPSPEL